MTGRIAILAALPREIAPLVRDWPVRVRSRTDGTLICECDQAIAVCAGMGRERVTYAFDLAEKRGPLRSILSVGYAGALRDSIKRSTLHWPGTVIDETTGQHFACDGGSGTLLTAAHVLDQNEKPKMAERWNADLVDMEAATVAALARMRGLPFRTLRAVSDEKADRLPDLNPFVDRHGGFRAVAFALHVTFRPWLIPSVSRLGRSSAQASNAMAVALREVLQGAE